MVISETRRAH